MSCFCYLHSGPLLTDQKRMCGQNEASVSFRWRMQKLTFVTLIGGEQTSGG